MARVRCPNCKTYRTYNIKKRLAKLSALSGLLAIGWFSSTGTFVWEIRYGGTAVFLLGCLVLLGVSIRKENIQYCRQCRMHFYPENVEGSIFNQFH